MTDNTKHSTPQLRFHGLTGEWEEKKLGEIFEKHNEKNDLSFGVDKIISVANMYYKQDANVGNDDYLRTYNIFRLGDIAYEGNKSRSPLRLSSEGRDSRRSRFRRYRPRCASDG